MASSRLLFESLESRLLLSGVTASESHSVASPTAFAGDDSTMYPPVELPKFDTQNGERTLLSVRLVVKGTATGGYSVVDSEDVVASPVGGGPDVTWVLVGTQIDVQSAVVNPLQLTLQPQQLSYGPLAVDEGAPPAENPDPDFGIDPFGQWEVSDPDSLRLVGTPTTDVEYDAKSAPGDDLSGYIAVPPVDTFLVLTFTSSSLNNHWSDVASGYISSPQEFWFVATIVYTYEHLPPGEFTRFRWGALPEPEQPAPTAHDLLYSGTAEPGSTLEVSVYGVGGELLGANSVIVDAGGNWQAGFPGVGAVDQPYAVQLRQYYAGYGPLADAGYNLRRYFAPALLGWEYASEYVSVENVSGSRSLEVSMDALYRSSVNPILLGWHAYPYEFLSAPATASGT